MAFKHSVVRRCACTTVHACRRTAHMCWSQRARAATTLLHCAGPWLDDKHRAVLAGLRRRHRCPPAELATLEHGRNGRSRCDMALQSDSDRGARAADDYRSSADVLYPLQPLRRPERPSGSLPSLPVRTSGALLQWHTVKYQRDMCLGRVPRADTLRPIHRRALWQRCRIPSPVRVQHILATVPYISSSARARVCVR